MTYYTIRITRAARTAPTFCAGWDAVYTDRAEAMAAVVRARRVFYRAQLVKADEATARRYGWVA